MYLMSNEKVLMESDGKSLALTTHRIRYHFESMGNAEIRSIMLEALASCALVRSSNIIFLVIAGACFALGCLAAAASGGRNVGALLLGALLAIVFVAAYFATRRQVLAFASAGTTISVNVQGMRLETAKQFIDQAEAAKNARYQMYGR